MDQDVITVHLKVPCYLLRNRNGFMMIDTGDASDSAALEKELDHAGVTRENLKLVILTHGDFDHAGNAASLQKKFGAKIAMHAADFTASIHKLGTLTINTVYPGHGKPFRWDSASKF